jgi:2-oxoglutarate dehydrogenase E1 component
MENPGVWNAAYIDEQYSRWKESPRAVSPEWQAFFQGFELGSARPAGLAPEALALQAKAEALIQRYRDLGHLMSCLDPLSVCPTSHPLLDLEAFGLEREDLEKPVYAPGFGEGESVPLGAVVDILRDTYCHSVGVEYMHLQDPGEREWLRSRLEPARGRFDLSADDRRWVLEWLCRAGRFEEFLQRRYLGQTRFSLEGAEALIPQLRDLMRVAAGPGCVRPCSAWPTAGGSTST